MDKHDAILVLTALASLVGLILGIMELYEKVRASSASGGGGGGGGGPGDMVRVPDSAPLYDVPLHDVGIVRLFE